MGEGAKKALGIFKGLCGVQFAQGVVFTTTMWDEAESSLGYLATCENREKRLCEDPEYWKTFLGLGSVTRRFRSSVESAKEVIKPILDYSNQARDLGHGYHLRLAKTRLQAEVGRGRQIVKTTAAHAIFPKDEACISRSCANPVFTCVLSRNRRRRRVSYDFLHPKPRISLSTMMLSSCKFAIMRTQSRD